MRPERSVYILLLALLAAPGAVGGNGPVPGPLVQEGALYVYLEPLESDASRLDFRVDGVLAVGEDGTEVPLVHSVEQARQGPRSPRQRLLASGSLPPGQYRGLAIRVSAATLDGPEGPVALTSPEGPALVEVPFRVRKREAEVLETRFQFRDSVREEHAFAPKFIGYPVERPAVGRLGLVSNRDSNTVTLFDKVSSKVVDVIPTGRSPAGIALNRPRQRAYVAVSGEDRLIAIGLLEYAVIERAVLRSGDAPIELALTPDRQTLLVVNFGSNTVSLFDTSSFTETARVEVGEQPRSVLVSPQGTRAYVLNTGSSSISVIDLRNRRLAGTISTDAQPHRGQFNRAGDALYVIHRSSSRISIVDPVNLRVTGQIFVGPNATALTVDPRSDLLYLSRSGTGEVEIFDPIALLPVDGFPVEGDVSFSILDVEQNYLYLLLPDLRQIQVLEVVGTRLRGRTETGAAPYWIVVSGEN